MLCLLVASIGSSLYLFQKASGYYRDLHEVRLDPLGLSALPQSASQTVPLAIVGDSRAAEWPAPDWLPGEVLNSGIGGQTTAQVLGRIERQSPFDADAVLIQAGINDLKTIALFPDRRDPIVANCKANLQRIIAHYRARGCKVILSTIVPAGEIPLQRRLFWSDEIDRSVIEVNAFLREQEAEGVLVFDAAAVIGASATDAAAAPASDLYRDALHLNAAGYDRLNDALADLFASPR
ncbi:MAG: SGNH/GDSL hydrolase family protein [Verrucomicrobiales bacterium]